MAKVKVFDLKPKDKKELEQLVKSGATQSRRLNRARILLLSAKGKSIREIADILNMSPTTVCKICQRYVSGGLKAALNEKPRPGAPTIFSGKQKAKITALACTTAPDGCSRWSLRLLADKAIELNIVESISYKTIENILKKTNLNRT